MLITKREEVTKQGFCKILWRRLRPRGSLLLEFIHSSVWGGVSAYLSLIGRIMGWELIRGWASSILYHFKMTNIPKIFMVSHSFRWISYFSGLWTSAVKHFIADSIWLIGILDEWAQNRFVNKWTISRLQASFLNQEKHSLVFHFFFNREKTPLRLKSILVVLF